MQDVRYWIWASQILGYTSDKSQEVMMAFGQSAQRLFEADRTQLETITKLRDADIDRILSRDLSAAEQILEDCNELGYRVITPDHNEYPRALRNIKAKPLALYVLGDISQLDRRLCISMVGTRKMSEYGSRAASEIAYGLASRGAVIVSGMANGIDQASHKAAIKAEGITIGVLGCGIDADYPKKTASLKNMMLQRGALISEFPPGTPPLQYNFPLRNRIISGLAHGTVVVEADQRSGSLITARCAMEQGRDVFAVPGNIFEPSSNGANWLLTQGARALVSVEDVLARYRDLPLAGAPGPIELTLGAEPVEAVAEYVPASPAKAQKPKIGKTTTKSGRAPVKKFSTKAPDSLDEVQRRVYDCLSDTPKTADAMMQELNIPIHKVLAALTELEIYGLCVALGGRNFVAAF